MPPARFAFLDGRTPLAMAHRGGAIEHVENTMAAFEACVALGYRYLETDVRVSADGVLLAFHDATLDRVTDGQGRIAELPYREVRRALIGGREPIPRLEEVLDAWPGVRLNVDLKADGAVDPFAEVVRRAGAQRRVCVASFSSRRLRRARRRLGPEVATSLGPVGIGLLRFAPRVVSRLLLPAAAVCVQAPVDRGHVTVVTPSFVENAHALGLQVHVWTIDDPTEMARLLDLGVDGIVTDRIDTLREVLLGRGQWTER